MVSDFQRWAQDSQAPVALFLKEKLLPVNGADGVFFPPTYAGIGYSTDPLPDGTKVAWVDSVGSQANRMEPLFKSGEFAALVPQITISTEGGEVSLLEVGHRLADALLRCSDAQPKVSAAFQAFQKSGDAQLLAKLAPTTLVFGAWDSRDSQVKLPRLVQSEIRAWGVTDLTRAAQYNPPVNYAELGVVSEDEQQNAGRDQKNPLAQRGFVHVPSTGAPGGVTAKGGIWRELVVNLIALRALRGPDDNATVILRNYILGLTLVAAAAPRDGFLRQGCILTPDPDEPASWLAVERSGVRNQISLDFETVLSFAQSSAKAFGVGPNAKFKFDPKLAKEDRERAEKEKKGKKGKAAQAGE